MAKKIEDRFVKLTDIEHVLLRPGMYIGSVKPNTSMKHIINDDKILKEEITFNPGLLKLFDEIIMNSIDESKREGSKLDIIKVDIEDGNISIHDNGGIPVEKHPKYNEWVPEMIFSNLKSGSNFDDDESREGAGTNGVGSVLANIYSTKFKVSTCDGTNKFVQTFSDNMRKRNKPSITKSKTKHTEISFTPDYEKFGLSNLDRDNYEMIKKRVYDISACNHTLKIYFNKKLINFKSFDDYIKLYKSEFFSESSKDKKWTIGVAHSTNGFQQVSFANSTETYVGGTHLDYITNQIIYKLRDFFKKKHKVDIRSADLKNHIFLFINSTVVNPSFSSQTKEKLITEIKEFGFEFKVSDKLIKSILKSEIIESVLDWIERKKIADESKLQRDLKRKLSRIKVDKLIDAKGKERWKCSLSIFEGDCLHEDTEIRVIRDGDIIDTKIKNVNIEDLVITHNNTISNVYALTKKIKTKSIIKTKLGEIISSKEHKWFVYDIIKNEFYFEKTINIDKSKHKLVKNYLAFTESLLNIEKHDGESMELSSGEIINTNFDHQFAIYDKDENKFKMCKSIDIDINKHLLVNIYKM
jgi:DNA topoisomerase II